MRSLQANRMHECFMFMKQAEAVVMSLRQVRPHSNEKLLALTLNNFGCYYKK